MMNWRFQKRVTPIPGVRLNLGKSGLTSISFGRRGAWMTFGRKGTRTTAGIPGTGLSYSTETPYRHGQTRAHGESKYEQRVSHAMIGIMVFIVIGVLVLIFS